MQDKILTILESATKWMTAGDVAEKGGYRSAGNVGVCLKNLGDRVVSRKSPTRKSLNGMPVVEWRHAAKQMADAELPVNAVKALEKNGTAMPEEAVVKDSLTTEMPTDKECCNAAKVVATTAGAEVAYLRERNQLLHEEVEDRGEVIEALQDDIRRQVQRAEAAEANRDDLKDVIEQANRANDNWMKLADEYECKSIPELRVFIESALTRIELLKKQESLIALNLEFVDGADLLEKVCTVMHERIHAPKLVANDASEFMVMTAKSAPRKFKQLSSAQKAAMGAARNKRIAKVYALVPVGKAVIDATWKDAEAA